ncbi:6083_t:CDS:2 [Paraglomus occultum]|uniref:6083_t:CDS:1 n=1 Tax=Paraglomus occultum TaxID=144539 RepID=A0A9N9AL06_9GLOM|nr:6083_t:CDS:2 [Paraglomus occultum]
MGCCLSRPQDDEEEESVRRDEIDNAVPRGGNKPFTKKGLTWEADSSITIRQLKNQRDAFWDTAPSYEGRLEIWQALRYACESEDLVFAQAILDSVNVTIPTGNLANGCYDELGNRYVIPVYCIVDPINLTKDEDDEGSSTSSDDMDVKLLSDQQATTSAPQHTVKIRLSNTARDIDIGVNLKTDTIAMLRRKICLHENLDFKTTHVRILFLGRVLEDKTRVADVKVEEGQVFQALITERILGDGSDNVLLI